jgi:hypothetical protein
MTKMSAYGAFVMNVFWPFSTQPLPLRRAVVCIEPNASDPAPGSVRPHAPTTSPLMSPGTQRSACAGVP